MIKEEQLVYFPTYSDTSGRACKLLWFDVSAYYKVYSPQSHLWSQSTFTLNMSRAELKKGELKREREWISYPRMFTAIRTICLVGDCSASITLPAPSDSALCIIVKTMNNINTSQIIPRWDRAGLRMLDWHRQHGFDPELVQSHEKIPLTLADSGLGSDFNLLHLFSAACTLPRSLL